MNAEKETIATKTEQNREYNKVKYDRIELTVIKGRREMIRERAEELNKSVNKYIKDLIDEDMEGVINEGQYEFMEDDD